MLDTLLLLFSTGGTGDHAPDRRFEFACQPHEDVRQLLVRNDVLQVHRAAVIEPSTAARTVDGPAAATSLRDLLTFSARVLGVDPASRRGWRCEETPNFDPPSASNRDLANRSEFRAFPFRYTMIRGSRFGADWAVNSVSIHNRDRRSRLSGSCRPPRVRAVHRPRH